MSLWALLWACSADEPSVAKQDAQTLSREELLKPETCQGCHPRHYREWASSMHAYAARDPIFRAMNQRGQREAREHGEELGDFCVKCHAPMAVLEGATKDGLNLNEVPDHLLGVTCYFCHNATGIAGAPHNNSLELAHDTTMRGGIVDPMQPKAHRAAYSPFHDRTRQESAELCGACHDVVNGHGVELERTFAEYKLAKVSSLPHDNGFETCQSCHMDGRRDYAAYDPQIKSPMRIVREHLWPGVDTALTDFPDREVQKRAIECALTFGTSIVALRPSPDGRFIVQLDTDAGHNQPSGSGQDRRLWLELVAYDSAGEVLFESGRVGDGDPDPSPEGDPQLCMFRDQLFDAEGQPVHMFWEAAPSALYPTGYVSRTLTPLKQLGTPHYAECRYQVDYARVARVTARLRMRAIGSDVIQDLIASHDLDPNDIEPMPTFTLHATSVEWRIEQGYGTVTRPQPFSLDCPDSYRCLLEPTQAGCEDMAR